MVISCQIAPGSFHLWIFLPYILRVLSIKGKKGEHSQKESFYGISLKVADFSCPGDLREVATLNLKGGWEM